MPSEFTVNGNGGNRCSQPSPQSQQQRQATFPFQPSPNAQQPTFANNNGGGGGLWPNNSSSRNHSQQSLSPAAVGCWQQQQQHHYQHHMPLPQRKESLPALHFNDRPFIAPPAAVVAGCPAPAPAPPPAAMAECGSAAEQDHRLERTRSLSTAFFCSPSPSSMPSYPMAAAGGGMHSPGQQPMNGRQQQGQQQHGLPAHRRTKSTVLPPAALGPNCWPGWSSATKSLHRFNSQLRSPSHYSSLLAIPGAGPPGSLPQLLKPYTPPPILSPMRQGSGLFNRIAAQKATAAETSRKPSSILLLAHSLQQQQQQQQFFGCGAGIGHPLVEEEDEFHQQQEGILQRRQQHLLLEMGTDGEMALALAAATMNGGQQQQNGGLVDGEEDEEETVKREEEEEEEGDRLDEEGGMMDTAKEAGCGGAGRPQRKNGTIFFADDGASGSGLSFAAELEQLRKQSSASHRSHKASMFGHQRMSIRHGKLSSAEELMRKLSSVSMDEHQQEGPNASAGGGGGTGEDGSSSGGGAGERPPESDTIPHINLGKHYQARVKKWAERAISEQEREAIPDRDELLFSAKSIEHIPQQALAAFESLACSMAIPRPGRNKELALHILAENQGNLQAAVMDLLRCDTLDWEQYPAVYNSRYVDVDWWSPEEINTFQDAIYKSEKDFQQVANECNRTVHESVAFYYTWKKACPDDYRKLRNLRRKRQLLEQQLDFTSFICRQSAQAECRRQEGGASSEDEGDEEQQDFSETESDITNPSLLQPMDLDCSPQQRKISGQLNNSGNLLLQPHGQQQQHQQPLFVNNTGGAFPWLHGSDGIFPSPSSSSTSTTNNNNNEFGGHPANQSQDSAHGMDGVGENGGGILHNHHHNNNHHHGFAPLKIRHSASSGHNNSKKGAQPQADGFFHCRLCEKRFEKVKSLNAHMKSHAMKARAEAEAQQKQHHQQHQHHHSGGGGLAFPVASKKEQQQQQLVADTAPHHPHPLLGSALGMTGLSPQAAMAAAALNNLGRQIQQQQQSQGAAAAAFNAAGNAAAGFGLLRNMIQFQQQQQHTSPTAAATGNGPTPAATNWPPTGLDFNA